MLPDNPPKVSSTGRLIHRWSSTGNSSGVKGPAASVLGFRVPLNTYVPQWGLGAILELLVTNQTGVCRTGRGENDLIAPLRGV
jgi:hypothetical protein